MPGLQPGQTYKRFDERTSVLLFRYRGPPASLLEIRITEDLFALAAEAPSVPSGRDGLAAVRAIVAGHDSFDQALALAQAARPRKKRKTSFRVIARKSGRHAFRRVDMQRAVEQAILDRFPSWRLVADDAQIEVWAQLVGTTFLAGARLSDGSMRRRAYRSTSLPAALKPTVAYAMTLLSDPRPDDVFLDPMCGSGTILIERATAERYRLILGGDVDPVAIQATRDNVGRRYQPIELHQWDARRLPLEKGSVSALVTNLPFGKQIGTSVDNRTLYPALLNEWARILADDGRMVLLTSERATLAAALAPHPSLQSQHQIPVLVRGQPASITTLHKTR